MEKIKKKFKIGEIVKVDNIPCEIMDIIIEDEVTYYEVLPTEFCSISRTVTIDKISCK